MVTVCPSQFATRRTFFQVLFGCGLYLLRVSFFFFQAEDGIRDGTVTGVQTCALPILQVRDDGAAVRTNPADEQPRERPDAMDTEHPVRDLRVEPLLLGANAHVVVVLRSEERRVGKECRSRWVRSGLKKSNKDVGSYVR